MKSHLSLAVAVGIGLCIVNQAQALVIDNLSGEVTDWSMTPFTHGVEADVYHVTDNTYATYADNYAPIDYPHGGGYFPSPGGATGEKYDLEELHARFVGNRMDILLVNSRGFHESQYGYDLGAMFVTINDQQYALVRQTSQLGVNAADVIRIDSPDDLTGLQPFSGSYLGKTQTYANDYGPDDTIDNIAGPFGVSGGTNVGSATIVADQHDYDGEADTWLIEYSFDLDEIGVLAVDNFHLHTTWGCGNDVIELNGAPTTDVPEPASMMLIALGGLLMLPRKKR